MAWGVWQPKRGWWHTPAGWALGLALTLPSAELAIPVSQSAGAWALPAEFTGIAVALAATVGFFVVKRHSWLLAAPLSFGLSFSVALALVEDWSAQVELVLSVVKVALALGSIAFMVAAFVIFRRMHLAARDITREIGEGIAHDGLFRDDGERIIVSADRGRVVLRVLTMAAILALSVAGALWARTVVTDVVGQIAITAFLALLLCFGGISTLLTIIRAMMTGPTLVVTADGILDNCSLIVTGWGLLRWNETLGVEAINFSPNVAMTYHYLYINVTDRRAINRRQPLWKRTLAIFASQRQPMGFRILRPLLDRPPAALVEEINRYIHTHAPKGSWHKAMTADEAEAPGGA